MVLSNLERVRKYNLNHPDRVRKKMREYTARLRAEVNAFLGNKCVHCGISDSRVLQIDHINGGGSKELKVIGGAHYWNIVLKSLKGGDKKYQLLCANCNWIKRAENKEGKKIIN